MSAAKNVLVGVTVGAILGILYAPDKGSETRRRLSDKGKDLKDAWNALSEAVCDTFEMARDGINKLADSVDDHIDNNKTLHNQEHTWTT